ncbi:MAG: hypothetical protein ACYTXC_05395 [Nostoc sp.]
MQKSFAVSVGAPTKKDRRLLQEVGDLSLSMESKSNRIAICHAIAT